MNRREWERKRLDPIHVSDIRNANQSMPFAHYGTILNASASGMLIAIHHRDLNADMHWPPASLDGARGEPVRMTIVEMNLAIEARVVRICHTGSEGFEMAVDFTENAPQYWRECLADLLPGVGEINPVGGRSSCDTCDQGLDFLAGG